MDKAQAPQVQTAASVVEGYVLPQFSVQIDNLAGPFLSVRGYLQGVAWANTGSSGWRLYDGLNVNAGIEVDPLGWHLGEYSVNLYSQKNLLASGGSTGTGTTPHSVPQQVTASAASFSEINVSWQASTDNTAVKDYQVYKNNSLWKTVTGTFAADTGLAPSTQACYSVEAVDVAGNVSAASNTVCATTPPATDNTQPTTPTGLTLVKVTNNSITLQWQASTDNVAVVGYMVKRNGAPITTVTAATLSYVNTPLAANTKYCYTISAFDAAGNVSAPSTQVCATTTAGGATAYVYVTNDNDSTVSVIDPAGNTVVATVPVGSGPIGVAVSPNGRRVYVANLCGTGTYNSTNIGAVSVIDAASNTVVATVTVGNGPYGVAVRR